MRKANPAQLSKPGETDGGWRGMFSLEKKSKRLCSRYLTCYSSLSLQDHLYKIGVGPAIH
jgi:hypothetical protein